MKKNKKLAGTFVEMSETVTFDISYIDVNGEEKQLKMYVHENMDHDASEAAKDAHGIQTLLAKAKGKKRGIKFCGDRLWSIKELKGLLHSLQIQSMWPELLKAHRRGENVGKFFEKSEEWWKPKGHSEETAKPSRVNRLRLTPSKHEQLLDKICFEIEDYILQGLGTQEQAYAEKSAYSKQLFGYSMTPKQIQGKYTRWKNNPKRSKYEK